MGERFFDLVFFPKHGFFREKHMHFLSVTRVPHALNKIVRFKSECFLLKWKTICREFLKADSDPENPQVDFHFIEKRVSPGGKGLIPHFFRALISEHTGFLDENELKFDAE